MVASSQRSRSRSRTSKFVCFVRLGWLTLICIGFAGSEMAIGQSAYEIAQIKSQRMAQLGIQRLVTARPSPFSTAPRGMRHIMPLQQPRVSRTEGVGYSESSPAQAIRNACHFGHRPIIASAVARGRDGYYATVYYR